MITYGLKKSLIILCCLVSLCLLSGCTGKRFDTKESTKILLPTIIQYDGETQNQAAKEIESGQCKALTELTKGYSQLRDRLRLIKDELK